MARTGPVHAHLHWLGDYLASRGRNPDMVNEWTRNDLPDHDVIRDVDDMHGNGMRSRVIDLALDTVVGHLNANHQKPEPDRWRRAHAIVEQERDQAREQWKKWEHKADEWRTSAEAAEARTAPAVTREDVEKVIRDNEHRVNDDGFLHHEVNITEAADAVCRLLGVEAEPADPVEEKARELAGVMHEAIKDERVEWHTAPAAVGAMAARLAEHILGQETKR